MKFLKAANISLLTVFKNSLFYGVVFHFRENFLRQRIFSAVNLVSSGMSYSMGAFRVLPVLLPFILP